ncbi:CDP-alcohol phosphatidyltransferase family protein [Terracoccus sp. 273MFTsu3.1]|uniref:CDP-alcohol phosphatidyltransferase family protein n=1 Tax=Terracoccus sp. 273MFTsu3.1 TaxID=1172188 RepID=UPI0018CAD31B|nr:CDP-alcohol phosphatidyltransferase family protein [Terracoccus sp. 273MFTsu3.1]
MTPHGPVVGLVGVLTLLAVLGRVTGLGAAGWIVGLASGVALCALLTLGLVRASRRRLLPADRVTLSRAVLVCGVAALVADTVAGTDEPTGVLVALASVALVLDAVDGRVARRTGTVHPLGARFDMETDAFLILVLSVAVTRDLGWWVLGVGVARYLLLLVALAARWAPWLRGQVPARMWRKVIAAYQGIVLTVAAAGVLPVVAASVAVAAGLALLVLSFGTEVLTLRRMSASRRHEVEALAPWPVLEPTAVDARVLP